LFDALSDRLGSIFDGLTGRGALSEKDVGEALREIRVALLEADVALPVVKDFIDKVRVRAVGEEVIRSVKPGQQVVKIVYDGLIEVLGGEDADTGLRIDVPPAIVMMAGLQGSGKTTTTAKLAKRIAERDRKKILVASLDVRRPAAMQQLAILATQCGPNVFSLPIIDGQLPAEIARRAVQAARLGGYDVLFLDTAGRTSIDEQMMAEAAEIAAITNPSETLLVADALTGQDAVETARRFHARLPLTGLVLTRMDGDGRGGAALSMRAVTGLPIKFLGSGEKLDGLDTFDARRLAGRILGQGDIVSLVEKASAQFDADKAEKMAAKLKKGEFDLDDMAEQFRQMQKLGGLGGIMGMMPGARKAKDAMAAANLDDNILKRQEAIILSMTKAERRKPAILNASRRKRIAAGAGATVQDVNKLLKMHLQMSDMMKKMRTKGGMKAMLGAAQGAGLSPADLAKMGGGGLPPGGLPGLGGGLPGLGGGLPGLGGGKKK
jgi:signal recognition particle subunit SRP54